MISDYIEGIRTEIENCKDWKFLDKVGEALIALVDLAMTKAEYMKEEKTKAN